VTEASTVFVVDDGPSVRRSTERLVRSMGFAVRTFASAKEFLDNARVEGPVCLVLAVRLPGLSGLDLQRELTQAGVVAGLPTCPKGQVEAPPRAALRSDREEIRTEGHTWPAAARRSAARRDRR